VVGSLLSSPPRRGELKAALVALSEKTWTHPVTGNPVKYSPISIERWYYVARRSKEDPVGALRRAIRKDCGTQSAMAEPVRLALLGLYKVHRSWTVKLIWDNLCALAAEDAGLSPFPSYSTVLRFMRTHGLSRLRRARNADRPGAQRALDLAVVLVHHTRKHVPAGTQAGQGLRGSSDLHAFGDSNLYVRRTREEIHLSMEHRAAAAPEAVALELVTQDPTALHIEIRPVRVSGDPEPRSIPERLLSLLEEEPGMNRGALRSRLRVNNDRLGRVLTRLEEEGRIERGPAGWRKARG
jgi:hypothetical protein